MSRHPTLKWAQRSDKVYITIELPDAKDVKLKLEPEGRFYFSAKSGGADDIPYEIDILLYDAVNVEESKAAVGLRNICYLVKKAEKKWWSRLVKQEGKPLFVKVDWDKWIDEDDENQSKIGSDTDFGDMDFSKLNMGGPDAFEDDDELERAGEIEEMATADVSKVKFDGASGSTGVEATKI